MRVPVYPYLIKTFTKRGSGYIVFRKSPKIPVFVKRDKSVIFATVRQVFTDELTEDEKDWMTVDTRLWDDRMR